MKIALGIEYDGSCYHGWQWQGHDPRTIQAAVESALSQVANHPVRVVCAGRTDAGVHATAQVVHFETESLRPLQAWTAGVNASLPDSVAVKWAREVPQDFHARYSAQFRRYQYVLYQSPTRPGLLKRHVTWVYTPLNVETMAQAAQCLIGEHDFTSFRAKDCQSKSSARCVRHLQILNKSPYLVVDIQANAFLKHMVRNIVGSLLAVGSGKREPGWIVDILKLKDRAQSGITAPPNGLYLVEIGYPERFNLPQTKPGTVPLPGALHDTN